MENVFIPLSFRVKPFFMEDQAYVVSYEDPEMNMSESPFVYDIASLSNETKTIVKPWERVEQFIPLIFQAWERDKDMIASLFRARNQTEATKPMIMHIANLIDAIFWINEKPVTSLETITKDLQQLPVRPINSKERLDFLIERPVHYHSYIQLSELFNESRKLYGKQLLVQKKKTN